MEYDIWYIFCYSESEYIKALKRLKISIKSISKIKKINIISWHKNLSLDLDKLQIKGNIEIFQVKKKEFSKSYYINLILKFISPLKKYFYLSDTDLFFHPEYFDWLDFICKKLNYEKNDLRIVTLNYNIRPDKKIKFIPRKIFNITSTYLPQLYKWDPPSKFEEILGMEFSNSGFGHGCGLLPIGPLREIGGYNEEIIGYGPEDDLLNKRIKFFARVYYHRGTLRSSTFHIYHTKLNYQNKNKNWIYWRDIIKNIEENCVHSDYIFR